MTRFIFLFFLLSSGFSYGQSEICKYKNQITLLQSQIDLNGDNKLELTFKLDSLRQLMHMEMMKYAGIPKENFQDSIIYHKHYILSYNEKHEQANWVMHILSPEIGNTNLGRTIPFSPDTMVKTGTAIKEDYDFPSYDRGHLAPSADFCWSKEAKNESYLYSNISPMVPEVNRIIWKEIENKLRNFVIKSNHHLLVITGPVLTDTLEKTGIKNQISVPDYFFKTVLDLDDTLNPSISFLVANHSSAAQIPKKDQIIDLVELEKMTRVIFCPNIQPKFDFSITKNPCVLHRYFYSQVFKGNEAEGRK